MLLQIITLCESPSTLIERKWFFTSVRAGQRSIMVTELDATSISWISCQKNYVMPNLSCPDQLASMTMRRSVLVVEVVVIVVASVVSVVIVVVIEMLIDMRCSGPIELKLCQFSYFSVL